MAGVTPPGPGSAPGPACVCSPQDADAAGLLARLESLARQELAQSRPPGNVVLDLQHAWVDWDLGLPGTPGRPA